MLINLHPTKAKALTPSSQSLTTKVHVALLGKDLKKESCIVRVPKKNTRKYKVTRELKLHPFLSLNRRTIGLNHWSNSQLGYHPWWICQQLLCASFFFSSYLYFSFSSSLSFWEDSDVPIPWIQENPYGSFSYENSIYA